MVALLDEPKAPIIIGYSKFCEYPISRPTKTSDGFCGDWHARFVGRFKRCLYHMPSEFVKPYHWRWWIGWYATIDRWGDQRRPIFDEHLMEKQKNSCAICRQKSLSLVLDHDHTWSTVRGLLCSACNTGSLLDRGELHEDAVRYKADAAWSLRGGLDFALCFSSTPREKLEQVLDRHGIRDEIQRLTARAH